MSNCNCLGFGHNGGCVQGGHFMTVGYTSGWFRGIGDESPVFNPDKHLFKKRIRVLIVPNSLVKYKITIIASEYFWIPISGFRFTTNPSGQRNYFIEK